MQAMFGDPRPRGPQVTIVIDPALAVVLLIAGVIGNIIGNIIGNLIAERIRGKK